MKHLQYPTKTEAEVIAAIMAGYTTNTELAEHLCKSVVAVNKNVSSILQKFELNDRAKIIFLGLDAGLTPASYDQLMERVEE